MASLSPTQKSKYSYSLSYQERLSPLLVHCLRAWQWEGLELPLLPEERLESLRKLQWEGDFRYNLLWLDKMGLVDATFLHALLSHLLQLAQLLEDSLLLPDNLCLSPSLLYFKKEGLLPLQAGDVSAAMEDLQLLYFPVLRQSQLPAEEGQIWEKQEAGTACHQTEKFRMEFLQFLLQHPCLVESLGKEEKLTLFQMGQHGHKDLLVHCLSTFFPTEIAPSYPISTDSAASSASPSAPSSASAAAFFSNTSSNRQTQGLLAPELMVLQKKNSGLAKEGQADSLLSLALPPQKLILFGILLFLQIGGVAWLAFWEEGEGLLPWMPFSEKFLLLPPLLLLLFLFLKNRRKQAFTFSKAKEGANPAQLTEKRRKKETSPQLQNKRALNSNNRESSSLSEWNKPSCHGKPTHKRGKSFLNGQCFLSRALPFSKEERRLDRHYLLELPYTLGHDPLQVDCLLPGPHQQGIVGCFEAPRPQEKSREGESKPVLLSFQLKQDLPCSLNGRQIKKGERIPLSQSCTLKIQDWVYYLYLPETEEGQLPKIGRAQLKIQSTPSTTKTKPTAGAFSPPRPPSASPLHVAQHVRSAVGRGHPPAPPPY